MPLLVINPISKFKQCWAICYFVSILVLSEISQKLALAKVALKTKYNGIGSSPSAQYLYARKCQVKGSLTRHWPWPMKAIFAIVFHFIGSSSLFPLCNTIKITRVFVNDTMSKVGAINGWQHFSQLVSSWVLFSDYCFFLYIFYTFSAPPPLDVTDTVGVAFLVFSSISFKRTRGKSKGHNKALAFFRSRGWNEFCLSLRRNVMFCVIITLSLGY